MGAAGSVVTKHIRNILKDKELDENSVRAKLVPKKPRYQMKFIDSYIKNLKSDTNWYEKTESSGLGIRVMQSH